MAETYDERARRQMLDAIIQKLDEITQRLSSPASPLSIPSPSNLTHPPDSTTYVRKAEQTSLEPTQIASDTFLLTPSITNGGLKAGLIKPPLEIPTYIEDGSSTLNSDVEPDDQAQASKEAVEHPSSQLSVESSICKVPFETTSFIISSGPSSCKYGLASHTAVEKSMAESVANSSDILCTQGVCQNAPVKLPFYFLPKKPPDEFLNVANLLRSNKSLPNFLEKTTFTERVFMTHATKAIYKPLLSDYIKVSKLSTEDMLFKEQDILRSMDKIEVIDFHQTLEVNGIRFWCYTAGHVLGAAMFMVDFAGVRILYNGDYSRKEDRPLNAAEIPQFSPDICIIESTYGDIGGPDAQTREAKEDVEPPLTNPELYEDILGDKGIVDSEYLPLNISYITVSWRQLCWAVKNPKRMFGFTVNLSKRYDGLGIFANILLVVFVTASSDYRQSLQFKDLDREKKKITIQVTRNGCRQKISIYDLLAGDIVHLAIGDQIPGDGLFLSGFSLLINESSLPGESEPIEAVAAKPFLLSGTKVQDVSCNMLVTTLGMITQWGKLMAALSRGGDCETPLQMKLNGVATIIGKIGLFFVVLVQGLFNRKLKEGSHWDWSADNALEMLEAFAVAVPEGLPLAVTLRLAFPMKKMMNATALVPNLAACETMGSSTTMCSDNTRTRTTNHMTVVKACIWGQILDVGSSGKATKVASEIPDSAVDTFIQSIFCSNAGGKVVHIADNKTELLGTTTEAALLEFGLSLDEDFQLQRQVAQFIKVEPFNSAKKIMAVVVELPAGELRAHDKDTTKLLNDTIKIFANKALRTLCIAYIDNEGALSPECPIPASGYTCIGMVWIKDPVCLGVKESVAICRAAGVSVRMVTGDNINTAEAIARECGILTDEGIAIEGLVFPEMSETYLFDVIPKLQVMARSSPLDKHNLVKLLRTTHQVVVAVNGDGTNVAPALHEADIGLAMGIARTEVAKESVDVIIMENNFSTIITVAKWGRSVYINIQIFSQFQLTVNVVALVVSVYSACLTGNSPLTVVQLLWVTMIMDTLGALALAAELLNDELMKRTPVGKKRKFITNVMWRNIFGQSVYQFIIIWFLQTNGKAAFHLDGPDSDLILIFTSFVFCEVFTEISSREMETINVFKGILTNYVFVTVLAATAIFQVILIEFLGTFASTVPLTTQQWFVSAFFGFLGMPIAAALKMIPLTFEASQLPPFLCDFGNAKEPDYILQSKVFKWRNGASTNILITWKGSRIPMLPGYSFVSPQDSQTFILEDKDAAEGGSIVTGFYLLGSNKGSIRL